MIPDAGREFRARVAGQVWPACQCGRDARAAGAPGGHQDVQAVDPAAWPGQGRDQPGVMGAAEAVRAQRGEQVAGDVRLHGEYRVPGEGDDRLQPGVPRRHAPPASVRGGEPAGRRGGDQPGKRVVREHTANRTDPANRLQPPVLPPWLPAAPLSAAVTASHRLAQTYRTRAAVLLGRAICDLA